jgi:hypothetical protein
VCAARHRTRARTHHAPPATTTNTQAAETLSELSGLHEFALAVFVTVACIAALGPLCQMFGSGGALFNPIHNAAFIVAGKGTLGLNLVRMAAQVAGALAGSYGAMAATPQWVVSE